MSPQLISGYYADLSDSQRRAADWQEGPFLLLAGPGSGKTRVLTARLARIISESEDQKFRVLALTFTNQAALEMRDRLEPLISDQIGRVFVGTFHSFCIEILRQHGSHVGVRPDFAVVSEEDDKRRILKSALTNHPDMREQVAELNQRNVKILPLIERMKGKLIDPISFKARFKDEALGQVVKTCYGLYEAELEKRNSLDFASILLRTHRLATEFQAVTRNIRIAYKYWSIDEFQDTTETLYRVLKAIAGPQFRNLFVVADEDQIIYQWNGASYQRIQDLKAEFEPTIYQLPTNYRCSADIVEVANNLIAHNKQRQSDKEPTKPVLEQSVGQEHHQIEILKFASEGEEAKGIADRVSQITQSSGTIAVLARNRYLLEPLELKLRELDVPARILQRRNDFLSLPYSLGYKLLKLAVRNQDEELLAVCVEATHALTGISIDTEDVRARARSINSDLYSTYILELERIREFESDGNQEWERVLTDLREREIGPTSFVERFVELAAQYYDTESSTDVEEDLAAWSALVRDIRRAIGGKASLDRFVQEMDIRSKEPPVKVNEVPLMTIHGAKGMEFDTVVLIGLAEEVLPSWHSLKNGVDSPEVEEERRNCFVAITRAKSKLILSYATSYRGYKKSPSRFLSEMGLG